MGVEYTAFLSLKVMYLSSKNYVPSQKGVQILDQIYGSLVLPERDYFVLDSKWEFTG